jgi:hypothetical protein
MKYLASGSTDGVRCPIPQVKRESVEGDYHAILLRVSAAHFAGAGSHLGLARLKDLQ